MTRVLAAVLLVVLPVLQFGGSPLPAALTRLLVTALTRRPT